MDTFVLIEADGAYWKVRGIFSNENNAILYAFKTLVDYALKPWIIDFYKDRDDEFANATSLPELHIEYWTLDGKRNEIIYIGFRTHPFRHYIDEYLKKKECETNDYENIVLTWKQELDSNRIHQDLYQFIILDKVI